MYSVNYSTQEIIRGSDFHTEQAAQNALADYIRLNTAYGIDVANVEVVRGGEYESFMSARGALINALHLELKHEPESADAYDRYRRAWDVKNPNESQTFESMGFAPHRPLTALNI